MASSRKGTNKTAHVLNVIMDRPDTGDAPAFSAPPPADTVPPLTAAPVVPAPAAAFAPVVEVERVSEDLSDQVRDALREELGLALGMEPEPVADAQEPIAPPAEPAPIEPQEPIPAAAPVAAQAFVPEEFSAPAETQTAALAAPEPVADTQEPSALAEAPEEKAPQAEFTYFNIMQSLVNEKTPKYTRLMGVCPCSRCLADVEALALSHLEPKYIVARKDQRFPFSAYENRYNAAVTSQIIAACQVVITSPRH